MGDFNCGGGGGGGALDYAMFYATPVGGFAPIAIDESVPFDADGVAMTGTGIVRDGVSDTTFILGLAGDYDISWQLSVDEPGQTAIYLEDPSPGAFVFQPETLAGRATGTNQITNRVIIRTTTAGAKIRIQNHSSPAAITLTPLPGGTSAGATTLAIVLLGLFVPVA